MDRNTTTVSVAGLLLHDEKTNRYRKDALAAGAGEIRTQPVGRLLRGSPGRDGTSKWPRSPVRICQSSLPQNGGSQAKRDYWAVRKERFSGAGRSGLSRSSESGLPDR